MIACSIQSSVVTKPFKCPPPKNSLIFFRSWRSEWSCLRIFRASEQLSDFVIGEIMLWKLRWSSQIRTESRQATVGSNPSCLWLGLGSKWDTAELSWTIWLPLSPKDNIERSRNQTQDLSVVLLQCQPGQSHKAKHIVTALKDWNSMFSFNSRF